MYVGSFRELHHVGNQEISAFLRFPVSEVSKEEQKKRFLDRIAEQEKNWKFSMGNLKERAVFDQYMKAYEEAISETSKEHAPWFVIPADQKWFARVAAIQIIIETLEKINLQYPKLSEEDRAGLDDAKKQLEAE